MILLVLKCLMGAVAVLLIAILAKSRNFFIAGLVPLFPTFALVAHLIVGAERSADDLRATALFGLWALIPYMIYLLVVYSLSGRCGLVCTLLLATFAWAVAAGLLIFIWTRMHRSEPCMSGKVNCCDNALKSGVSPPPFF